MTQEQTVTADDRHHYAMFTAGRDWAQSLKAGDTFRGSYGEAHHRGLTDWDAKFFSAGAYAEIASATILLAGHDSDTIHSITR